MHRTIRHARRSASDHRTPTPPSITVSPPLSRAGEFLPNQQAPFSFTRVVSSSCRLMYSHRRFMNGSHKVRNRYMDFQMTHGFTIRSSPAIRAMHTLCSSIEFQTKIPKYILFINSKIFNNRLCIRFINVKAVKTVHNSTNKESS